MEPSEWEEGITMLYFIYIYNFGGVGVIDCK
jgi:hypothetical protein